MTTLTTPVTLTIEIAHRVRCVVCGRLVGDDGVPVDLFEARDVGAPLLIMSYACLTCAGNGGGGGEDLTAEAAPRP